MRQPETFAERPELKITNSGDLKNWTDGSETKRRNEDRDTVQYLDSLVLADLRAVLFSPWLFTGLLTVKSPGPCKSHSAG